jgi:hypothetical protein
MDGKRPSLQPRCIQDQRKTPTTVVGVFYNSSPITQISRKVDINASAAALEGLDSCQADIPRLGTGGNAEWPLFPKAATQIIENLGN